MSRNHFTLFLLSCLCIETATARSIIDCRIVTGGITECNPYGAKFLKAKEIMYDLDRQKLIIEKTLPVPEKTSFVKVVSVADMIEKYVKIEECVRFKGSAKTPIKVTETKEPVAKVVLDEKIKVCEVPPRMKRELLEQTAPEKPQIIYGKYIVERGDALSKIAKKFGLKTKELAKMNGIKIKSPLRVGQKLKLPFEQKMIDAVSSAKYIIEEGDTLISIAKKFKLEPKELMKFNGIKRNATIRTGKIIKLPLPHILAQIKTKKKLRVTATAYTSHAAQTDSTPFLAAWNNRLRPGMKIIAVSRDMLTRYGMRNGTKVRIAGLPGYYRVRDKMNKRYKKRIDIYMGLDRRRALRWGRRSVVVYW
jgi:LysM repeat protein